MIVNVIQNICTELNIFPYPILFSENKKKLKTGNSYLPFISILCASRWFLHQGMIKNTASPKLKPNEAHIKQKCMVVCFLKTHKTYILQNSDVCEHRFYFGENEELDDQSHLGFTSGI